MAIPYARPRTTGITTAVWATNGRPDSHSSTPSHQLRKPPIRPDYSMRRWPSAGVCPALNRAPPDTRRHEWTPGRPAVDDVRMVLPQTEPSDGAPEVKAALAVQDDEAEAPFTVTAPVPYAGSGLRNPFPPIADYAFLSDCENTCLISSAGSVEWLCVPRPDSASVFGAILDRGAGHFRLGP